VQESIENIKGTFLAFDVQNEPDVLVVLVGRLPVDPSFLELFLVTAELLVDVLEFGGGFAG